MKQGWEYKKLGEVCNITMGQSPDGKSINDNEGVEFHQGKTCFGERTLGVSCLFSNAPVKLAEANSVLLCVRAPVGYPNITNRKICIGRGLCALYAKENIDNTFLFYSLLGKQSHFEKNATGSTFKAISSKVISNTEIPFPPKSTQLSIVSELDKINELIRLKKEQLKDYDNLAQSIFYEMFGDPVENEKGWEVKELGQLCEVTSSKRVFINEVVDAGVPFIRGTELTALNKLVPGEKMHYTLFITQEHYERVKAITGVPKVGDLLIPSINADGIVWMVDTEEPLYFKDGRVLWIHVNHNHFNSIAIQKLMNILIKNIYASMGGATFAELKLFVLRNMKVPIPPLSVQDAFAEKIKRIDIQKLQVKKSITDLETLLASRMQYWFE